MINIIITKLKDELSKIKTLLSSSKNETTDFIEYYNEEIEKINRRIQICQNLSEQAKTDEETVKEFNKQPIKNIVFATTSSGNISIEKDFFEYLSGDKQANISFYDETLSLIYLNTNRRSR